MKGQRGLVSISKHYKFKACQNLAHLLSETEVICTLFSTWQALKTPSGKKASSLTWPCQTTYDQCSPH